MVKKEGNGYVKWFSELSNKDIKIAGGKGASLAEMYNNKFPIPPGFMITAQAYSYFLSSTGTDEKIYDILRVLDVNNTKKLDDASKKIRALIEETELPEDLKEGIVEAYQVLDVSKEALSDAHGAALNILRNSYEPPFVAVRSSATAEDLADASFAGQHESFLNVKGEKDLLLKIKKCFSSLFMPRAIYYREKRGFKHEDTQLAVVVQKMIDSDKSGVIFSRHPVKKDDSILIEAVFGLGEGIVSGMINPDQYVVSSDMADFKILDINLGNKKLAVVRDSSGNNKIIKLNEEKAKQQVLTSYEIKMLAQYAKRLEEHYKKPQDIEFAICGRDIYVVQSRPITTKFDVKQEDVKGEILLSGLGASPGVASGFVRIVHKLEDLEKVKKGDVLVTEMTNPDMVVSMQRASGIITDEGGVTSHAAIVSREMGIPAVVGTGSATSKLKEGQIVTVDGNNGKIVEGKSEVRVIEIKPIVPTRTKIKVIVDLPDFASRAAETKAKAVGLTRIEGIIASSSKHPLYYEKEGNMEPYVELLYSGLRKIAEHFDEMWIRTSDIRSDEYRHLEGAVSEVEGNPMLGDHGIRFSLKHPRIFEAELRAIKKVASEFRDKKFGVMIPQLILVEEFKKTEEHAKKVGLPENVSLGVMIETPAAVQIINELCESGIKFISFGTNDLTQYILAIDRNNSAVQNIYNEMNPAVLSAISYVLRRCKKYGVETSICGQAASREDMAEFLVKEGISSISVNADAAFNVSNVVAKVEGSSIAVYEGGMESIAEKEIVKETNKAEEVAQEMEVPMVTAKTSGIEESLDMEEAVLKELDESNEYEPGDSQGREKAEIPSLNEAIPVDSEHLNAEVEEKIKEEIELEANSLDKEWNGSSEGSQENSEESKEEYVNDEEKEDLDNEDISELGIL